MANCAYLTTYVDRSGWLSNETHYNCMSDKHPKFDKRNGKYAYLCHQSGVLPAECTKDGRGCMWFKKP